MDFEKIEFFDEAVRSFYNRTRTGVFLFNLLADSTITVFHDLNPVKGLGNGVVLIGPRADQERLGTAIAEKLLHKKKNDGFWDSVVFLEDKLVIVYAYREWLEPRQIIELLSLKLRYDLSRKCAIELAPLSFIQVKIKGEITQNIPLKLKPEQELLQRLKKTVFF